MTATRTRDFGVYVHDLKQEIARGEKRARKAGYALPVPARAARKAAEPLAAE